MVDLVKRFPNGKSKSLSLLSSASHRTVALSSRRRPRRNYLVFRRPREPISAAIKRGSLAYLSFGEMDKSMMGDLDNLPEEDKLRMSSMIDQLQIRDSLRMYNSLVERCFNDCVDSFKHKNLQKQEETCVNRCAEKFLKHSMRVGMRFAELNQGAATQD